MTKDIEFWNKLPPKYYKSNISDMAAYEFTLERTRHYLRPDQHVLELGCGTGTTALALAPNVGTYDATDAAQSMIDIGNQKKHDAGQTNLTLFQSVDVPMTQGDAPYDCILAFNFLHLVHDQDRVFQNILDRLKPGGLFISKTFCMPRDLWALPIYAMRAVLPILTQLGKAPNVHFVTMPDWDKKITNAGFDIIETGAYPLSPPRRFVVARKPE